MGYQSYAPPGGIPAEAQSIKSMLHIVRILAIIFGILLALGGIAYAAFVALAASTCASIAGNTCVGLGFLLVGPIILIIFGLVDLFVYMQMKEIESMVDQRQYESAKSKTLVWMIVGFILGGILLGILLLIAYLKFDPLINWQRGGGGTMPAYGAPPAPAPMYSAPAYAPPAAAPPMAGAPPPAAAPAPAPAPAAAPTTPCTRCGRPATWVAQYNRWYCPTEQTYL